MSASVLPCGEKVKGMSQCASKPKKQHLKHEHIPEMPFQFKESKNVIVVNCNAKSMRIKIKLRLNVSSETSKYASI